MIFYLLLQTTWHIAFMTCFWNSNGSYEETFLSSMGTLILHNCNDFLHGGYDTLDKYIIYRYIYYEPPKQYIQYVII